MTPAMTLCLLSAGGFLLTGMLLGVWKYHGMMTRPDHRAHIYVDQAHRAALWYSFASIVLMTLAEHCAFAQTVQLWAAGVTLFLFASALVSYIGHGVKQDTENQFQERNFTTTWAMYVLIGGKSPESACFSLESWQDSGRADEPWKPICI